MAGGHRHAVSGIVLLDKPKGLSSNQALGRTKRIFGQKKAGHTGTLDPMATGLLVVCLGHATRMCAHLMDADKAYAAKVHLGVVTDTEDAEGQVIATHPVPKLTPEALDLVLEKFRGEILQVPPMYSALKHKGERLYEIARRGETIERPPRKATIHALKVVDWALDDPICPGFSLEVSCTKGTYIRSLVRDIGQSLGCGAHLSQLVRTKATPFSLADAHPLDALEQMSLDDAMACVLPMKAAVPHWPVVALDAKQWEDFRHGRFVGLGEGFDQGSTAQWVVVESDGRCVGLAHLTGDVLQPRSVFDA